MRLSYKENCFYVFLDKPHIIFTNVPTWRLKKINSHAQMKYIVGDISTNCFADMKKIKKFPLAEFLGFIISAKKCAILGMSEAMEKCKNRSIFSKLHIRNLFYVNMVTGGNI